MTNVESIADQLVDHIRGFGRCVVAFSGGVDSAVVAKAAYVALGDEATAITAVSPSLAQGELQGAVAVAEQIGIRHEVIKTAEFANPFYIRNAPDRCFHCKSELYHQLDSIRRECPNTVVMNGTNTDDADDYRPGLKAAAEHQVRSPLVECHIDKSGVRELAKYWSLSVWDKPAMPCLSSRVAYGETVTPERLSMIDKAEAFLRKQGFHELRVRYHKGDLARVEVAQHELPRLLQEPLRSKLTHELVGLGFKFVTVDLAGFRSGNLNNLVPIELLRAGRK